MELTKGHRISLMNALSKCNEEIEIANSIIERAKEKIKNNEGTLDSNQDLISSFEIQKFLNENRKELIEMGLINNEIDF